MGSDSKEGDYQEVGDEKLKIRGMATFDTQSSAKKFVTVAHGRTWNTYKTTAR
jgi:hypothetical protein